jgi:phospho-N-acetylmuramoyl-pentapeptide-transferase
MSETTGAALCRSGKEENMLQLLSGSQRTVDALGFLLAFALTALMDSVFREKLPQDHGRAFAVNGELSKGKARGSGLIFVLCIALVTLAVVPLRTEYIIYTVLLIASMLSGYFDDASEVAWNEYKKGLIDLVIAIVAGVTYLNFNSTAVHFLNWSFAIPYPLYLVLIVVLIWASINVVNCTDGVDGLSASLAVVSIGTFLLAYGKELGDYATAAIVFIGALLAYLWMNAKPSTLLMGDAGSRAMGFFLAVLALKSGHPFSFLLVALVFIVDGSLGILKISFKRFLHISILKNTLTPLHDHVRKRMGWSDEQVVARWLILQAVASAWLLLLTR